MLVVASITLITLSERGSLRGAIGSAKRLAHDAFAPVPRGVDRALRPVGSMLSGVVHYGALQQENVTLRRELQRLQGRALRQGEQLRVAKQLSDLQHVDALPGVSSIPTVTAQVVALNSSDFADTVDLSKGTAAGIDVGMPVVTGSGLVGRVVQAWASGCTVRLITDTSSAVSVDFGVGATTDTAVLSGKGHGDPLEVDFVPPGVPLHRGTILVTSGLQHGLFPAGLPVATVTKVSSSASATQQTIAAQPTADLASLQYVDILQWQPPPLPGGVS